MKRNSSMTVCVGLVTLTNLLFCAQVSMAGMDAASTNTIQRPDEQAVIFLERTGQYDQAEARCMQMLQQNPSDADAKRLLAEIQNLRHEPNPSTSISESLETIIIPEVNFREAGVADVIEFLRTEGQKVSGARNPINFVWDAPESLKTTKITLSLRQVPLADALKYVTVIAGLRYRVDPHAVVIYPAPPPAQTDFVPSNVKSP